nr:MAG TPA: hypothetical protein [Caudoviricetes sp.]
MFKHYLNMAIPPPSERRGVHRMMISQTGDGKPQGAELVPPAERTKTHTGRPKQ